MVDVVDAATRLVSARYPDNTLYISLANADCNSGLLKNTFLNDFMPNFTSGHESKYILEPTPLNKASCFAKWNNHNNSSNLPSDLLKIKGTLTLVQLVLDLITVSITTEPLIP